MSELIDEVVVNVSGVELKSSFIEKQERGTYKIEIGPDSIDDTKAFKSAFDKASTNAKKNKLNCAPGGKLFESLRNEALKRLKLGSPTSRLLCKTKTYKNYKQER